MAKAIERFCRWLIPLRLYRSAAGGWYFAVRCGCGHWTGYHIVITKDAQEATWDAGEHEGCGKDTERALSVSFKNTGGQ